MTSLSVVGPREDDFEGNIHVTIGPVQSQNVFGINVSVNNHIESEEKDTSLPIPVILMDHWEKALKHSKSIAETTIKKAIEK